MLMKKWLAWVAPIGGVLAVMSATYSFTVHYLAFTEKMEQSIVLSKRNEERLDVMQPQLTGLNAVVNRNFCKGCK